MKYFIFLILFIPLISFSQEEKVESYKSKDIKKAKAIAKLKAKTEIKQLHNGVLLVRLSTKKNTIKAMRKANKIKLADKTVIKLRQKHLEIIRAFRSNFNFCPVYFFYSDYSEHIRNNQLDSVIFLNDSLQLDPNIKINGKNFLTAQFGITEPDTKKYSSSKSFEKGKTETTYQGGSGLSLAALIMKDDQLEQLSSPFPYYIREYSTPIVHRTISKMVLLMNYKLKKYYQKSN